MKTRRIFFFAFLAAVIFCGCAALDIKNQEVAFESPETVLNLRPLQPNARELQGITLRLLPPQSGEIHAEERLKLYSQLRGNQGMALDLSQQIKITTQPAAGKDAYVQRTVTTFNKGAGEITDAVEVSPRGEVLRFIEGRHESQAGKFEVLNMTRTPLYPEVPVKIGDKWNYSETMNVRLESFWVKEKNPEPYIMKAESTLTGFAEALGRRCAVIKTVSTQTKKMSLKVLFKAIDADITTNLEETDYLDYQRGLLIAKVTQTRSRSVFQQAKMEDQGISQAIYKVIE